jgi:nucleotide-binding universal stress UspA family protein
MKKIVVGYDDTDASRRALERAASVAQAFGSELIVISVAPVMTSVGRSGGPADPVDPPEKHAKELEAARSFLEGKGLAAHLVPGVGDPADTIIEVANERSADLVVVGSRELGLIQRLLGQSVSGSVARQAQCDVLIVH